MTLSFSTRWPKGMGEYSNQPNYFTNKIMKSMWKHYPKKTMEFIENRSKEEGLRFDKINPFGNLTVHESEKLFPKLHTIRAGNRWREGMKIHPVINNRTKDRFQFAPTTLCIRVQEIEIYEKKVKIDGRPMGSFGIAFLAMNDGFESVDQFFTWFNTPLKGQIVHWTDLKY